MLEPFEDFEVRDSDDPGTIVPVLVCPRCNGVVSDVEHGDSLGTLTRCAADHLASCPNEGGQRALAAGLRRLADDQQMLWEVARRAIEDALVEWRDSRLSTLTRNNGFVIKEPDGSDSSIIRFGPETGVRIALLALADHLSSLPAGQSAGGAA